MNTRLSSGLVPKWLLPAVLLFCVLSAPSTQADHIQDDASGMFYEALAPYGNWVHHRTYGRVWYPRQVPRGWQPYTDGYWAYTNEYGWLWVSDWIWGWAAFHYGRWVWDDWYGWIWVPGTIWAPAWVFWRYGGGYASWAPMPPEYSWNPYIGYTTYYFDYDRYVPWYCWVIVREKDFPIHHKPRRLIAPGNNREILKAMPPIDRITVINNTLVNQGIPVKNIEKAAGKRFKPIAPTVLTEPKFPDKNLQTGKKDKELIIYRPVDHRPTPDLIRQEEQKARQIAERVNLQPDLVRGHTPVQAGKSPSEPGLPGRLSGKPMPLDYQEPEAPISILPELSRPRSPVLTLPEAQDILPMPNGVPDHEQRLEEINKARIQKLQQDETERRQKFEMEKLKLDQQRLEQEKAMRQQQELERQHQNEVFRLEQDTGRQQQEMNRNQQTELERQREAEQQRMEQEAIRQQEDYQRRQQELERQQQIEQQRLDQESFWQQGEMNQRRQQELERQQQIEQQRLEQEAIRQQQLQNQQQELERQQRIEQQRLEQDVIRQQQLQSQQWELDRQRQIEQHDMEQQLLRQQQMQRQQQLERLQIEQEQRIRLESTRQQQELMRQQGIEPQPIQQQPLESNERTRGNRMVIRGDRNR